VTSDAGPSARRSAGIACRGLSKRYGRATALDGLDLTVGEGEIFGFLGPNGAGKTTTLRILLGLIRPTTGSATINGHDVPDPAGLADVGAMVEEPAFYPWLSGRTNLRVLAQAGASIPAVAIEEAMDRAGIASAAGDKVKTYSQGMRQRLGLAAALMRRPRLLLLDEPTNGLDPAGIRDFRSLLRRVADEGATVFLSSRRRASSSPGAPGRSAGFAKVLEKIRYGGPSHRRMLDRERYPECAPMTWAALDLDRSFERLDEVFDQTQAQAKAPERAGA